MKKNIKRLTTYMDSKLYKNIRLVCLKENLPVYELINDAVYVYLKEGRYKRQTVDKLVTL